MRFSLVPRLLPGHPRPTASDAPPSLTVDGDEEINRAVLSGVIAAAPARDTSREGAPITVLLLSFDAPDEPTRQGSTCCEVEVPDSIADRHRGWLRVGRRIWVTGQLNGSGLWATSLDRGRPATARTAEARL
jgi:primosomal replication protein N